ncbi:DUF397 domain-containing protein [Streptomyces sp. MMBL 11-3]|uniref:DUF397 domain-containing protein n=1 Tax=Streptomyces sp. MMBL 11-3 TaxID=3382639 RepID=UPI0039B5056E
MVAPTRWKKASHSGGGEGNDCVEVATTPTRISIRDSKTPVHGMLVFPADAYSSFIEALKNSGLPMRHVKS